MTTSSPWPQRMLWMCAGVVLTTAAFLGPGLRPPVRSVAEPGSEATARPARPAGAEPREGHRPPAPEC